MKKEQTLLIVCLVLAALLVWMNLGLYEEVGASTLPEGATVGSADTVSVNPQADLPADRETSRSFLEEFQTVRPLPLPEIEPPGELALPWVAPAVSPRPFPESWHLLRHELEIGAAPAESGDETASTDGTDEGDDEDLDDEGVDPEELLAQEFGGQQANFELDEQDQLIRIDGTKIPCRITPKGALAGQPKWVIIESWPNVTFGVEEYNDKGTVRGRYTLDGLEALDGKYKGVELARLGVDDNGVLKKHNYLDFKTSLAQEYWERRIKQRVADGGRQALIDHAVWVVDDLAPKYGVPAQKLALGDLEAALKLGVDLELVTLLGETYRRAYELEGEIDLYQRVLVDRANDSKILSLLAGAYYRLRAYATAHEVFERAAQSGDIGAKVGMGECLYAMGRSADAFDVFKELQNSGDSDQRTRALTGLALIHLDRGDLEDARAIAQKAVAAGARTHVLVARANNLQGAVAYYSAGQTPARWKQHIESAERSFKAAEDALSASGSTSTTAKSNRAFALARLGKLTEARVLLQACMETDPFNYLDPLIGMGYIHQRWDQKDASNDAYQTAKNRVPADSWVRLTLATIRLRDGLPDRALALAEEALADAPGLVDALRIAGLACGALAQRDKAVEYLGRASQMEPANANLIYQHCRALIAAGRRKDATRILETVTHVTSGVGKQNALLLTLLAHGKLTGPDQVDNVLEALARAGRSNPTDATDTYIKAFRQTIVEWRQKRVWTDGFDRQPGTKVGNGWQEEERYGPRIGLKPGEAVITGTMSGESEDRTKTTRLFRDENLKQLISAEVGLKIGRDTKVLFHMFKGALSTGEDKRKRAGANAEIGLGCDRDGALILVGTMAKERGGAAWKKIKLKDGDQEDENAPVRKWPEDGEFHVIRIERINAGEGRFAVFLDDEQILGELEVPALKSATGQYTLGFLVDAPGGANIDVTIDYVRMVRTTGR